MNVLGISCFYHDAAAALISDGILVAAAEEERFTRRKHDFGFPHNAIRSCLRRAGVDPRELDLVVFYEKPIRKFERILSTAVTTVPRSLRVFVRANRLWLGSRLQVRATIASTLGIPSERVRFAEHHESHAASAYYCSPFEEAAVLTVDGVGEWACATVGRGSGSDLRLLSEQRFPHSLGLLYSTFTAFLGFEVNEGEYKVMGLASYGEPTYVDHVRETVRVAADGSIELDLDYFDFMTSTERPYSRQFIRLFGEPFRPEDELIDRRRADIAASIQLVLEEVVVAMARHARAATGLTALAYAGGVALNATANGRLVSEGGFDRVWVQPAAGDSGGALGAALVGWHQELGGQRTPPMRHAYWGDELMTEGLAPQSLPGRHERLSEDRLLDAVAELMLDGKVIGWCRGRFEWGPRALGHRSILADPRRADMKDRVNRGVKFREPFRPFAPSLTAESGPEFLTLPAAAPDLTRFMLLVVPVEQASRDRIPAVVHVDGTCRPQLVDDDADPAFRELLRRFGSRSGVPVLLNTSFNLRGEPMVATAKDALATFSRSDLDALVLDDILIRK